MNLIEKLKGGDLRSIGKSNEVVLLVGNDQQMFDDVFSGIFDKDPLVRMRCADVAEKVSAKHRNLLVSHKDKMLDNLHNFTQQEVKWHMALMVSYLDLSTAEVQRVFEALSGWIKTDESKIVRVNAMQALADISLKNRSIRDKTIILIQKQMKSKIPSLVSRGKKLLKKIAKIRSFILKHSGKE